MVDGCRVSVGSGVCGDSPSCRVWGWSGRLDVADFGSFLLFTEILWILLLLFAPQFVCSAFPLEVCHKRYEPPLCPSFKLLAKPPAAFRPRRDAFEIRCCPLVLALGSALGALGKPPAEGSHQGWCPPDSDFAWMEVSRLKASLEPGSCPCCPPLPGGCSPLREEMRPVSWSSSGQICVGLSLISQWYQVM